MKKLFVAGLSALMLFSVAGCGTSYDETVREAPASKGYTFHAVGGFADNNWTPLEANKMDAVSIADVGKLSKDVANKLTEKNPVYVYMKKIDLGTWTGNPNTKRARKADGTIINVNGAFTFKCLRATWNSEESKYINDQWIPDPKTANAEALTDNIFIPPWQEAEDPDGFSWADDTACLTEAGEYYFVAAQYADPDTPSVNAKGYGLALIKA